MAIGHWVGGLNRKRTGSVVQSSCVSGGPTRGRGGSYHFLRQNPLVYTTTLFHTSSDTAADLRSRSKIEFLHLKHLP